MGVSRREYARRRGVSESAVRKAILYGRITPEPDGTIDPDRADREWDERTDPMQQRGASARNFTSAESARAARADALEKRASALEAQVAAMDQAAPVATAPAPETRPTFRPDPGLLDRAEPDASRQQGSTATIHQLKQAELAVKVQILRTKQKRDADDLVSRHRATALFFTLFRRERDAWQTWPARVAANMAAELGIDPHRMEDVLDRYVREHFAELAEPTLDLTTKKTKRSAA
jgi:hypothetical protein